MDLFFSKRAECYHCHVGLNFSTAFRSATATARVRPLADARLKES